MDRWQAWIMNLYQYDAVEHETKRGIRLRINRHGMGSMSVMLPKKCIRLYRHLNEVEVPEWLCIQTGLFDENQ